MALEKSIISRTSGSGDSMSQVFLSNTISSLSGAVTSPLSFEVPVYTLGVGNNGATFNYYMQTTDGISASLNNIKSFMFFISANTESLSGTTKMQHDIYRLDYNTFTAFTSSDVSLTSTTVNPTILSSGTTALRISPNSVTAITEASLNLFTSINEPIYTTVEDVSGTTFMVGSAHTLTLPQKVKPVGLYTQDLFVDKAQYFIDSTFLFEQPVSQTLGAVEQYSGNQIVQLYDMPYSSTTFVQTSNRTHVITGGTFAGTSISGASFTYFVPPKKPDIFVLDGHPTVEGVLNTFSPIFSFRGVEDGDKYAIKVTYNTGDTTFTGSSITSFRFDSQPGNAEYIRTVAVALTPNSEFLYKIGNVKEIINLFSVKQNITTWSEFIYAKASNDGTFELSGHTYLNLIGGPPVVNAIITLTILSTNSSVDLGSDTLSDPSTTNSIITPLGGAIGTTIITTSDINGFYTFGKINGGNYTVTCQNPDPFDFPTQTVNIFLSSNLTLDFIFSLLWGNTVIDFSDNPPGPFMFL